MVETVFNIIVETWSVLGEMSPYLLFGFLVAGILSVCISPEFVGRHLGGRGFGPVWKAAVLGVPLPLCSCGVIPVAASFHRHGASRASVASFLLTTPQIGVDSIAVTYGLLGWVFAVFRPIVALATGLIGGLLVMLFAQPNHDERGDPSDTSTCTESCCSDRGKQNLVWRSLKYGFVTLPRDIGVALLVGVVIAGAIAALTPPNQWHAYLGGGIGSIFIAILLGTPLYVCSSASVPIAVGLMHLGASPGTALAFLIAGPATNAATIATLWKLLGRLSAGLYLLTVAASAVFGGLLLDWIFTFTSFSMPFAAEHDHAAMTSSWTGTFWAILLLAVLGFSYAAKPREDHDHDDAGHSETGPTVQLAITGMTCDHCKQAVANALRNCRGVTSVTIDLAAGRAIVAGTAIDLDELLNAVKSAGYEASAVADDTSKR